MKWWLMMTAIKRTYLTGLILSLASALALLWLATLPFNTADSGIKTIDYAALYGINAQVTYRLITHLH